jgi:hypothetical protein
MISDKFRQIAWTKVGPGVKFRRRNRRILEIRNHLASNMAFRAGTEGVHLVGY